MRQRSVQIGDGLSEMSGALSLDVEFADQIHLIFNKVSIKKVESNDFADAAEVCFRVGENPRGWSVNRHGTFVKRHADQTGILFVPNRDRAYCDWMISEGKQTYVTIFCGRSRLDCAVAKWVTDNPITYKGWDHKILGLIERINPAVHQSLKNRGA